MNTVHSARIVRFVVTALILELALASGCKGRERACEPACDASPADSAVTSDAVVEDATAGDASPDGGLEPADGAPARSCRDLGGLCTASIGVCTGAGGGPATRTSSSAGGCAVEGFGICCIPPAAEASGNTCESHGGVCQSIGECALAGGAFAPPDCDEVGIVCCVPQARCGLEDQVCCMSGGATFRATCDRGTFTCTIPGTVLMPRGHCS